MDEFGLWDAFATGIGERISETYVIVQESAERDPAER